MTESIIRVSAAAVLLIAALPCLAETTTESNGVIRSVEVWDGNVTVSVRLKPFYPEAYLRSRLDRLPEPNRQIVEMLLSYPREGQHDYWWPRGGGVSYDGSTTDILIGDTLLMKGEPKSRTFCCGLTLEVFYRMVAREPAMPTSLTSETASLFKKLWFCLGLGSPGPGDALTAFQFGISVPSFNDAIPGDFIQIWRNNKSGHSVIFVCWARDPEDRIIGIHYWSTQPGTKGINFNTELFGTSGKTVNQDKLSISRMLKASEWKPLSPEEVTSASMQKIAISRKKP